MGTLNDLYDLDNRIINEMHMQHGIVKTRYAKNRFHKLYNEKHGRPQYDKDNLEQYKADVAKKVFTMARYFAINYQLGQKK